MSAGDADWYRRVVIQALGLNVVTTDSAKTELPPVNPGHSRVNALQLDATAAFSFQSHGLILECIHARQAANHGLVQGHGFALILRKFGVALHLIS